MSLYKQFKTNLDKEQSGIEVKYGANEDGSIPTFTVSRLGASNRVYAKAIERASRPHRRMIQLGQLDTETDFTLTLEVFVDTILKGWENVFNEDGTKLEYSRGNALGLMRALPDLYTDLRTQASDASNFRDAEM